MDGEVVRELIRGGALLVSVTALIISICKDAFERLPPLTDPDNLDMDRQAWIYSSQKAAELRYVIARIPKLVYATYGFFVFVLIVFMYFDLGGVGRDFAVQKGIPVLHGFEILILVGTLWVASRTIYIRANG